MSNETLRIDELIDQSRQDPDVVDASDADPRKDVWRRLFEVWGADFDGAWDTACQRADEIRKYMRRRTGRRAPFDKRIQKARAAIHKIEARVAQLEALAVESCQPIQDSIDLRERVLDEFRVDYAPQLHLKKSKHIVFPAGTLTFKSNATRTDFAKTEEGKRDDAKLSAWVDELYDLVPDRWDELTATDRKLDVAKLKGCVELSEGDGLPWYSAIVSAPLPDALQARVDDEDDAAFATAEKVGEGGEILTYLVSIPFVHTECLPSGEPIRTTHLYKKYAPADRGEPEYTLEFVPAEEE